MASYAVGDKVEVHNAWGIDEGTVVLIGRQYRCDTTGKLVEVTR